jgi:hypothetical protein
LSLLSQPTAYCFNLLQPVKKQSNKTVLSFDYSRDAALQTPAFVFAARAQMKAHHAFIVGFLKSCEHSLLIPHEHKIIKIQDDPDHQDHRSQVDH